MKILIIVYVVSWLVLLAIYVCSLFDKNKSTDKEPWYLYALLVVFAPLVVLLMPHIYIQYKKQKKEAKAYKEKEELEQKYNQEAISAYHDAIRKPHDGHSFVFGMTARTIVGLIGEVCLMRKKEYSFIMQYLDKLSLPKGTSLLVEECKREGMGDKSCLLIETPERCYDLKIWDYIKAEDSLDGAWQAYFLYKVWHIMPLFWHANYDRRTYLYSKGDEAYIIPMREEHTNLIKNAVKPMIIEPDVVKSANGKYYVSCCYWSDFAGLIQEIVEVNISPNNNVSFKDIAKNTLYEYECGIYF